LIRVNAHGAIRANRSRAVEQICRHCEEVEMTTKKTESDIAAVASGTMDTVAQAVTDAVERSRGMIEASAETWNREAQRYFENFAADGANVAEQLKNCKSPLDVLNVEQAWIASRSRAYMESGLRIAETFAALAGASTDRARPPAARREAPPQA
jgi:hypothetical protein